MDRNSIIEATNLMCNYLDKLISDKTKFVDISIPLSMKSVKGYKINSIIQEENRIAFIVEFECIGIFNYSKSRFYFVKDKNIVL